MEERVESEGEVVDVVNPATCKVIAKAPISTKDEIDRAVEAAKEAFPEKNTNACKSEMPLQAEGTDGGTFRGAK